VGTATPLERRGVRPGVRGPCRMAMSNAQCQSGLTSIREVDPADGPWRGNSGIPVNPLHAGPIRGPPRTLAARGDPHAESNPLPDIFEGGCNFP